MKTCRYSSASEVPNLVTPFDTKRDNNKCSMDQRPEFSKRNLKVWKDAPSAIELAGLGPSGVLASILTLVSKRCISSESTPYKSLSIRH